MHLKRKKVIRQITEDLESFSSVSNKECFFPSVDCKRSCSQR